MLNFSEEDLGKLIERSRSSRRRRAPLPLHADDYAGPQALINAIQPDSYMRPHRHDGDEIWIPVRGHVKLVTFEETGIIMDIFSLFPLSRDGYVFTQVPEGVYHSAFAVDRDSVFGNISQGPFDKTAYKEFATWAPDEEDRTAGASFLTDLKERC